MEQNNLKVAEAALFMSAEPLTLDQIGKLMKSESFGETVKVIDELIASFNDKESALEIVKTTDSRYRMQVRREVLPMVKDLAITTDFSKSVLRTLAIIAFKQPIKQSIVVKMRGNKSYDHIHQLDEEGFVKKTREGNTYLIETTKKFIDYFGEPIKGTDMVPKSQQEILDPQTTLGAASEVAPEETGEPEEQTGFEEPAGADESHED